MLSSNINCNTAIGYVLSNAYINYISNSCTCS